MHTHFEIPDFRLGLFRDRFAALVKRAEKLGCAPPTCTIGEVAEKTVVHTDLDGREWKEAFLFYPVTVEGEAPKFAGWTFIAVCDYEHGEAPIFRSCISEDLPVRFRTLGPVCEHCKLRRGRKETFVGRHEDGRTVQVGRQCIRDFLGHKSPEQIAGAAELVAELRNVGAWSDDDPTGGGPGLPRIEDYLAHVARQIRLWGWRAKSACADPSESTASQALEAWYDCLHAAKRGLSTLKLTPTASDDERAAAALTWARAIPVNTPNDYQYNLRAACSRGVADPKNVGIIASAVAAYDREQASRVAFKDEYVGKIGERLREVLVRVIKVIDLGDEGGFGFRELIIMRESEGRSLVWATGAGSATVGKEYLLTGTVKRQQPYRGVKQTTLSRCELTALGAPTKAEVRAIERLSWLLDCAIEAVPQGALSDPEAQALQERRRVALKACDLPALEAIRAELHDALDKAPGTTDAERAAIEAVRASIPLPKAVRPRKAKASLALAA